MTTAVRVDSLLERLARLRDDGGVLSVYADVDPGAESTVRPPWRIVVEDALRDLRARLREEGPHERWAAFDRRLHELQPSLDRLLDASEHGRGRALFAGLDTGEQHAIAVQAAFPTRVTLGDVPHLVPLLAADEGAPAGLVVVGRETVRTFETRCGELSEHVRLDVEPTVTDGPERKGAAAPNPLRRQQTVAQRERYARHVEAGHRRLLAQAAEAVARLAAERGWELAVVAGDPRGTHLLAEALGSAGIDVERVDRDLEALPAPRELAELAPAVARARRRRDLALVLRVRDAALSAGHGALGLGDVGAALEVGRVDHLLLDGSRDLPGGVGAGGELVPARAEDPGPRPDALLADRVVLRALAAGARVTAVDGDAAAALADAGGIAALLRW